MEENLKIKAITYLAIIGFLSGCVILLLPRFIESQLNLVNIGLWVITISILVYFLRDMLVKGSQEDKEKNSQD